ncbi:MAG: GAF domain-containing protein [Fuerstiella sp.]
MSDPFPWLIRYVEVWVPTEDGSHLTLQSSRLVGEEAADADAPGVPDVRPGEGVAGRAWQQKSATILQEDPSRVLDGLSDACGTTLKAVLAIPVFRRHEIRGVVVLGCGDGLGAAEVWSRDDRDELAVSVGLYAGLPSFEFISRYTKFPKGAGIPGKVWTMEQPQLARDPEQSGTFIRSFGNDPAQISAAIGLPVNHAHGFAGSVLLLLSDAQTPLARDIELWECRSDPATDEHHLPVTELVSTTSLNAEHNTGTADAAAPEAWQQQILKQLTATNSPAMFKAENLALPDRAAFSLAIPFFRGESLTAVLTLLY